MHVCVCVCKSADQEGIHEFILVTGEMMERSDPEAPH